METFNLLFFCVFQLRLSVHDSANPSQKVYANMVMNVRRNTNAPQFDMETKEQVLLASTHLGASVTGVTATDEDEVGTRAP